jgi:hypothetical protein
MLEQRHERARTVIAEIIAAREEMGAPLDDEREDWREEAKRRAAQAWSAKTREEARAHLRGALAVASEGLQPLRPYRPLAIAEGVEVKFRALSKGLEALLRAPVQGARYQGEDQSSAEAFRAFAEQTGPVRSYVSAVLAGIRGIETEEGPVAEWSGPLCPADLLDALDVAGLLFPIYEAAVSYQELDPLPRRGFGSPLPSTSPTSTAAPVHHPSASSADASATDMASPGSPASGGSPADVPWPTSGLHRGSSMPSVTTAPVTGEQGSQTRT